MSLTTFISHKLITVLLKSWTRTQNQTQAEILLTSGSVKTWNLFNIRGNSTTSDFRATT